MRELTFAQIRPLIRADLKVGQTPALLGEPGIGKSSLIEDLARDFKTKVFTLPVNQLADRADLTGVRMTQNKDTGSWRQEAFPHSIIMESIEYAENNPKENPILFLDEFNRASSDITSAILSFQTLRRIGTIDFPDNLRLIIAGNDKGNVTALDGASISRFSVYKVKPDLDTFLSVQELNPFIVKVLRNNPDDLVALETKRVVAGDDDDTEDVNDTEEDDFGFSELELISEGSFDQITRPRTITYTSNWLNALGIDSSKSEKEKEVLKELMIDSNDDGNVLLTGIIAHVGETTFAYNLYDEIVGHFNEILSTGVSSNQSTLTAIRPKQDLINQISRAKDVRDIEEIVNDLEQNDLKNATIWLMENINVKEIDNNQAVKVFIETATHNIEQFNNADVKNLMSVLPESERVSKLATKSLLDSSAPVVNQWRAMLESIIDND